MSASCAKFQPKPLSSFGADAPLFPKVVAPKRQSRHTNKQQT